MSAIKSSSAFLLAVSIILSAAAQLFMKLSMLRLQFHDHIALDMATLSLVIENNDILLWLLAGLICYGISMLAWMFALIRYDLSFAYPFLGITYVLVYLGAVYWSQIGEQFSWQRTAGIVLILIGVIFVNHKSTKYDDNII